MAVMLPDGSYQVQRRAHPWPRDDHGQPVPPALGAAGTARLGGANEQIDGTWSIRLDPAEWPLYDGDKILGPSGRIWTVTDTPQLNRNRAANDVDYIAVHAALDPPLVP
jgi:hypothetical protein